MDDYTPPTQEEIARVAAYWQRVKDMACAHPSMTFESVGDGPICGECRRPLRILSDVQIEDMRRAADRTDVNVRIADVLRRERGGVTVMAEGQWHDLRAEAWGYDGRNRDSERFGYQNHQVVLMLAATDVRDR